MVEKWADVLGFVGFYQVSTKGRIRSVDRVARGRSGCQRKIRGRLLVVGHLPQPDGRPVLCLWKNNKGKTYLLCRIVLEAFVGPCPDGMECCHFPDRDVTNCKIENLRWATRKDNKADQRIHGTIREGELAWNAKLREQDVVKIRKRLRKMEPVGQIAKDYGVSVATICDIRVGRTWTLGKPKEEIPARDRAVRGSANHNAKNTEEEISRVKKLLIRGSISGAEAARVLGVSQATAHRIKTGKVWKHA